MDGTGTELFGNKNKKQAMEAHDSKPVPGISHTSVPQWDSTSCFLSLSGEFADRLFGFEPIRTVNLVDRGIPSVNGERLNIGIRDFEDQYNNASMGLSLSHFEDPSCFNLGGIRKVKVNEVRDSGTGLSASMGISYGGGDDSSLSMDTTFGKRNNNTVSLVPNNIISDKNTISVGRTFSNDFSFFSMGHTLNKEEENCILMGYDYSRRNDNISLMGQTFDKCDGNFISIGLSSKRGDINVMSMGSYNKECRNFLSIGQTYDKANENFISVGSSYYNKRSDNPMGTLKFNKPGSIITLVDSTEDKGDSGVLSTGDNFDKGETNAMSFGGYHDEPVNDYHLLMGTENSAQDSQEPSLLIGTQNSARASQEPKLLVGTKNSYLAYQEPSLLMGTQNSARASREPSVLMGTRDSAPASQVPSLLICTQNSAPASQEQSLLVGTQNSAQASQEQSSLIGTQNSVPASQEPNSLMGAQNSAKASQEPSQPNLLEPNVVSNVNSIPVTNLGTVTAPKTKAVKKAPANNFPSSVKSLLSTGMLDGIPVKYVSWSREKNLKGTIKRTRYLCGCSNCNYTKALNAYEFEHHANCKTKHPNNHIYFENGKTIYGVVQDLKNTPQDMLYDAIQNVTGSQINQNNYRIWKAIAEKFAAPNIISSCHSRTSEYLREGLYRCGANFRLRLCL